MSDIDIHQLAAAYVLDAVDDHERAAFEAHYPSCELCATDVGDFRETAAQLAEMTAATPPTPMRDRVLAQIATTRQLPPLRRESIDELAERRRRRQHLVRMLGSAAAVVALAVAAFVIGQRTDDEDRYAEAAATILARPDTRVTDLSGPGDELFRVAWSPSQRQAVVTADGLTAPGAGRAYELWLIDEAGPHPVGLLDAAPGGRVRRVVAMTGTPVQWAVTVESDAGADAPTGEILFVTET